MTDAEAEPEPVSEPESGPADPPNVAACKECFALQKEMALGAVTPDMMQQVSEKMGGYFAESIKGEVNPQLPGPACEGDFGTLMGTFGPIWMGFVITKIENASFEEIGEDKVKVTQLYDNHLLDDLGEVVPDSVTEGFSVTNTCTFVDGKIAGWVQEYDSTRVAAARAAVVVANTVTVDPVPVTLPGPKGGGSVEQASAVLKRANADGLSLYDHLSDVLGRILKEKPDDALAQLEEISAQVKQTRFVTAKHSTTSPAAVTAARVAAKAAAVKKALFTPAKGAINPETGCRDVPEVNTACAPATELPVLEAAELLEAAGVGLGKPEAYRIALAVKKLAEDPAEKLTSCRFWGKVIGTKGDYLVCECTADGRETTIPALTDEEKFDQGVILAEPPGVGANKYVYYVCSTLGPQGKLITAVERGAPGPLWRKLPDVTPAQLAAAAKIKKLFTGDLDTPLVTHPAFPGGTEEGYLRAQLTRITVATAIAPASFYEIKEEDEEEAEEENPPDKDPVLVVAEAEEGKEWELVDTANWLHTGRPMNEQNRCSWYFIPKRPKPKQYDEDGNEIEEEEEEPEEPGPVADYMLPIGEDVLPGMPEEADAPPAPWVLREYKTAGTAAVAVRSVTWPGAVAVAAAGRGKYGVEFANVYIGSGAEHAVKLGEGLTSEGEPSSKAFAKPYQPEMPPAFETEFEDDSLVEVPDKTVAEEKEYEEQQEALKEQAADAEEEEE